VLGCVGGVRVGVVCKCVGLYVLLWDLVCVSCVRVRVWGVLGLGVFLCMLCVVGFVGRGFWVGKS
jgi:hypothetical protein